MNLTDLTDLCCGITFPIIGIVVTVFLLYLRKKGYSFNLRSLWDDDDAVMVISRAFAIGVPLILVTIFHTANAFGIGIWEPLLSIALASAIIISGAVIAVLGLKVGFYYPMMLIFIIWVLLIYVYLQFEANII